MKWGNELPHRQNCLFFVLFLFLLENTWKGLSEVSFHPFLVDKGSLGELRCNLMVW